MFKCCTGNFFNAVFDWTKSLDVNVVRVADVHLGVHDQLVAFHQHGVAVGDDGLLAALDEDDDRLAGNVKVADHLTVPRTVLEEHDLLEVDVLILVKQGGAQNQRIAFLQNGAAARTS